MKLCILNTGGTISCVGDPLAPMPAVDFAAAAQRLLGPTISATFPDLTLHFDTGLRFPGAASGTLDSTNLQPSDWCRMAEHILAGYDDFDGFIVLHGTDSLDCTGAALPLLLNVFDAEGRGRAVLSKPVVLTGSQVPLFHQPPGAGPDDLVLHFHSDAYRNLCGALATAQLGIPEVSVFFDGNLFRGNRLRKVSSSGFAAFASPNYPVLAEYGIGLVQYPERMLPGPAAPALALDDPAARQIVRDQLGAIKAGIDTQPVVPLKAFPAPYDAAGGAALIADLIAGCVTSGARGLVLESYGGGNFPSGDPDRPTLGAIFRALAAADAAGVVVIDGSQVIAGKVALATYAAGAWLAEAGAIGAGDMTPMAAQTKATILLAAAAHHGWSRDQVKSLIARNLVGEMRDTNRLDSRSNASLRPGQQIAAHDGSALLINDPQTGPALRATDPAHGHNALWQAGASGTLVLRDNGNLILRGHDGAMRWQSGTDGMADGAFLTLLGSWRDGDLALALLDQGLDRGPVWLFRQQQI